MSDAAATIGYVLPELDPEWQSGMERRRAAQAQVFAGPDAAGRRAFPAASLTAWLRWADRAGVPAVPATELLAMPWDVLMRFDEPRPEDAAPWAALEAALAAVPADHMVRWDPCSSLALKEAMADGRAPAAVARELCIDDPRAFDILFEYPLATVPIVSRPWLAARAEAGYPVEFRVFVRDDAVLGVSSYYPQRPLPATPEILSQVDTARSLAERLVGCLASAGAYPWMESCARAGFAPGRVHASLDFIVAASGEVVFLEAGPPFGAGAHPCCFLAADAATEICGVALAPVDGAA